MLIFRDVSAQRRVQRERSSQLLAARLLASIIESSDDAILSKSLDGIIQSWNAAAERLFGYTAAQAVGRHISLIIPPDRIDEEDRIIASLKAGHRIDHFETERMTIDGRRLLVSLTISPIKDDEGRVIGASKIVRDVTDQRQLEQRERQLLAEAADANAKFQAFFEQGALFAGIMDLDGTLLEANRLSWEACGFTKEQVIGKPFWEGPWWSPSAQLSEQIRAASAQAARGETFRAEIAVLRRRRQRTHRGCDHPADPGRRRARPVSGADRRRHHRRKRVEAERRRLEDNLRTWPRICPRPTAARTNSSRCWRTSCAIRWRRSATLRERCASADTRRESLRSASDMLERQVRQMSRLVDDLLDMSRITRGRIELRKEPLELAPVVSHAVEAARVARIAAWITN